MFIRIARTEDIDNLVYIHSKCFLENYDKPWDREKFSKAIDDDTNEILCYEFENKIVGFIIGIQVLDFVEIITIAVLPEFKKLGIGTKLLKKIISNCKAKECFLEVAVTNTIAILFYEKFGFQKLYIREKYYKSLENKKYIDAIVMKFVQ